MRILLKGAAPSCFEPPLPNLRRLGGLVANESSYVVAGTAQLSFPNMAGAVVRNSYVPPTFPAPVYAALPKAPTGSQGSIDFPYTIKQPQWTGNFFWWMGGPVMNIGYPQYSNDCWEYLRYAVVDSDWDSVLKWFEWAAASFKWSYTDAQRFDFGAWRWIAALYAPAGTSGTTFYRPPTGAPLPIGGAVVTAPRAVSSGGAGGGAKLAGLGAAVGWGPPYAGGLQAFVWWSKADFDTFYRSLMKYANAGKASGACLDSVVKNWYVAWTNYMSAPGGPKGMTVSLGQCPMNDNFWQGFGIFVAAVVTIYVGGALLATAFAPAAGAGAAVGVAPVTGASLAIDTGALTAANVAAGAVTDTAVATAADTALAAGTLEAITVTSTPIVAAAGLTATQAIVGGAIVAGGAAAVVAMAPSASVLPTQADLNANIQQPDLSANQPPPNIAAPPPSPSLLQDIQSGAGLVKSVVGAGQAVIGLTRQLTSQTPSVVMAKPPVYSPTSLLTGTTFGIPNLAWLAIGGLGILIATRKDGRHQKKVA